MSTTGLIFFAVLMGLAFFAILWTAIDSAKHRAENNHRGKGRIETALSRDVHSVNGKDSST